MKTQKNNAEEEFYVPIESFLKKDTKEILQLKSLAGKEAKYLEVLFQIELAIAEYYYCVNKKLTDTDVKKMLKNTRDNYMKGIHFFKDNSLERDILFQLSMHLEDELITFHELRLSFDYILWSIDNRNWMPDKQAYVKWITYTLHVYEPQESERYERYFYALTKKLNIPKNKADALLGKKTDLKLTQEEIQLSNMESEFYSLDDKEKQTYLIEYGTLNMGGFQQIHEYLDDLLTKKKWDAIEEFYNAFINKHEDFIPIYYIMGVLYAQRNKTLAKFYLQKGIDRLQQVADVPDELEKAMIKDMEEVLSRLK